MARAADRATSWAPIGAAVALFVLVGASRDNAARPPLGPHGWAPGSWIPLALTPAVVTGVLVMAYGLGVLGTYAALLSAAPRAVAWWPALAVGALILLTQPFGSADHVNYAAYGRILVGGGDPYTTSPIGWHGGHDPVTSHVEPPWTTAPSVYGPVATYLQGLAALVGGANLRQVVWVWQAVVVSSWLATRWLLRRLTDRHARVDALWTFNPLVLGVGVFGAHVDVVAAPLVLAAVLLAVRSPLAGGLLAGLAVATKATDAVVVPAVAAAWWVAARSGSRRFARSALVGGIACVATLVATHVPLGSHVYDQLLRVRRSVSLATPWRPLVELLTGPLSSGVVRTLVSVLAAVVMVALAAVLWRLTAGLAEVGPLGQASRVAFVLAAAYAVVAPYSLPWYDTLAWAALAPLGASRLDGLLLARGLVMAVAYVPGRVLGMTPRVERLTLGFRRHVAPVAGVLAWAAVAVLGVSGRAGRPASAPSSGGPPRESPPPSR